MIGVKGACRWQWGSTGVAESRDAARSSALLLQMIIVHYYFMGDRIIRAAIVFPEEGKSSTCDGRAIGGEWCGGDMERRCDPVRRRVPRGCLGESASDWVHVR